MAHCPSCNYHGPSTKGFCPQCRSRMKPGRRKGTYRPPSRRRGDMIAKGVYYGVVATIMLLLVGMIFVPSMRPYGDQMYEAFMRGLNSYQEIPDYAEFTVERQMSIQAAMDIQYSLMVQRPGDLVMPGGAGGTGAGGGNLYQELLSVEMNYRDGGSEPAVLELKKSTLDENGDAWDQTNYLFTTNDDTFQNFRDLGKPLDKVVRVDELPAGQIQTISITYQVRSYSLEWTSVNRATSGTLSDLPQNYVRKFIDHNDGDQWVITGDDDEPVNFADGDDEAVDYRIEPTNPQIRALAQQLTSGHSTVYGKARAIFDYLDAKLTYRTLASGQPPKSCTDTLNSEEGDCDDQSILFISLCRAAGIPAWLVGGVLYDYLSDTWVGHGWAQVLIPMKDGTFVTPTVDVVNDDFLFRDPNRLTDWVDDGSDGALEDYYSSWSYVYYGDAGEVRINDEYVARDYRAEEGSISIKV